jgi:hypothetical protein
MKKTSTKLIIILATCCSTLAFGQIAPVSSRTTFTPPYSAQLSDWSDQISLTLLLRDLNVSNGRVFVRMQVESATVSLQTKPLFVSRSFQLVGGVPLQISGSELGSLFMPENLEFSGITRETFIRNGSRLPEGRYRLWFEVYELSSKIKVSAAENFAVINLHDIDPPILNFPQNNNLIFAETPQNIMFSWSPRHQSAIGFRSVYDFEMVQIPQHYNGDLQILFEASQKYSEKALFQTQFRYSAFDEELVRNQRYAWRVRVRNVDDNNESFQVKNNGYSEIFSFRYAEKCEKPSNFQGFSNNHYTANLSWIGDDFKNQYLISYRRSDNDANAWFSRKTSFSEIMLDDLSPNQTYEIKIRTLCEFTNSDESEPIFITTPALLDSNQGCGISFIPNDTCIKPLKTLTKKDIFTSSGTTIYLNEISGSDGFFSGKGYIKMPILGLVKLNVIFENIRVNECFQHTDGIINVVYDEENNLFADLDSYFEGGNFSHDKTIGDDCETEYSVNFSIDEENVELLGNGDVQVGKKPNSIIIPQDKLPITIQDKDGKIYEITENGEIKLLAQTSSDDSTSLPKDESQKYGVVLFSKHADQITAFDDWQSGYGNSTLILKHYEKLNESVIPYQLVEAKKGGVVRAIFESKTDSLDPEKIIFRNGKNTIFQAKLIDKNSFDVSLIGSVHGELQVISAIYVKDSTEFILGKLFVPAFEKKSHNIKLIPTFEKPFDFENLKSKINHIFEPYLVDFTIRLDDVFLSTDWDLNENGVLDVVGSGWASTLTDEMRAINRFYREEHGVDDETLYLFLFETGPSNRDGISIAGDMPRGSQFGYLFLDASQDMLAKTVVHEIGHGLFRLKHTFDNDYKIPQGSTNNLMDYGDGTFLSYWQWLQLFDSPTVWGIFEGDDDAMAQQNKLIVILQQIRHSVRKGVSVNINLLKNVLLTTSASFQAFNSYPYQSIAMKSSQTINTMKINQSDILMHERRIGNQFYYDLLIGSLTITLRSQDDQRMLYRYLTNTGNSILFVNGYRFLERNSKSDNVIAVNDRHGYWDGIHHEFVSRLKSSKIYYADGHMSIATSNHINVANFYCSAKLTIENAETLAELGLLYTDDILKLIPIIGSAFNVVEPSCKLSQLLREGYEENTLNTKPNTGGFHERLNEGIIAGRNLLKRLQEDGFDNNDTLDIVCHSMGFAYALGIIGELGKAKPNIKFGGFYIIAPENPSTGRVFPNNFMQVWHYGSNENEHPIHKQDGVAPQSPIQNLENNRAFIPNNVKQGFVTSHSIGNYQWIFSLKNGDKGYVMLRK